MSAEATALPPETLRAARLLFLVAALYDGVLGVVFFVFYEPLFDAIGGATEGRKGYIQLLAAFVAVQGLGYWFVHRSPLRNIDLVRAGVAYKVAYSGVAFYYASIGDLPSGLFLVFAALDLVFLAGFIWFLWAVNRQSAAEQPGANP